ncbi:MAG: hypothetical protein KDC61_12635, partial [Saprospiraceae bacterium]|nr:hypothetical protein [Saprospiraceae bacterium]
MTCKILRTAFLTTGLMALVMTAFGQNPVKWSFSVKDAGNCQVDLIFTGAIDDGWYTYSQFLESDEGPVATLITFDQKDHFKLVGTAKESGEIIKVHDKVFDMNLTKFKHKAILTQRVEVSNPGEPIAGYITYMTCNDEMCLPPRDVDFEFKIGTLNGCGGAPGNKDKQVTPVTPVPDAGGDQGAV